MPRVEVATKQSDGSLGLMLRRHPKAGLGLGAKKPGSGD